eukprot:6200015-Pleurochrysis_carterae.AAC.3
MPSPVGAGQISTSVLTGRTVTSNLVAGARAQLGLQDRACTLNHKIRVVIRLCSVQAHLRWAASLQATRSPASALLILFRRRCVNSR